MLHFCRKRRAHRAAQMRRKKKHVDARKELCNFCSSCELCAAMSFTHKWAKTESSSSLHLYWTCESAAMTFQVHYHQPYNRLSKLIIRRWWLIYLSMSSIPTKQHIFNKSTFWPTHPWESTQHGKQVRPAVRKKSPNRLHTCHSFVRTLHYNYNLINWISEMSSMEWKHSNNS